MSALIERMHPEVESVSIAGEYVVESFRMIYAGALTLSQAKTNIGDECGGALTEDESDEFDALYALRPSALSGLTGLLAPLAPLVDAPFYQWCDKLSAIFHGYSWLWPELNTAAEIRAAVGLPNP